MIATFDSVFETRPPPFRIIFTNVKNKDAESYGFFYLFYLFIIILVIAISINLNEISEHWNWLNHSLMPTLTSFEQSDEITKFVLTKIETFVAINGGGITSAIQIDSIFFYIFNL